MTDPVSGPAVVIDLGESPQPPEPRADPAGWGPWLRADRRGLRVTATVITVAMVLLGAVGSAVGPPGLERPSWSLMGTDPYLSMGASTVYVRPADRIGVIEARDLRTGAARWDLADPGESSIIREPPGAPGTTWLTYPNQYDVVMSQILDAATGRVRTCLSGFPTAFLKPSGLVLVQVPHAGEDTGTGAPAGPGRPDDCRGPQLAPGITAVRPATGEPVWHVGLSALAGHLVAEDEAGRARWLVGWDNDQPVQVWDIETGAPIGRVPQPPSSARPAGSPTRMPVLATVGTGAGVAVLTESRDGQLLAHGYALPTLVRRWTATLPMPRDPPDGGPPYYVWSCGRLTCVTGEDVTYLLAPEAGRLVATVPEQVSVYGPWALVHGPRGSTVGLSVLDSTTGQVVARYPGYSVLGDPDGDAPMVLGRVGAAGLGIALVPRLGAPPHPLGVLDQVRDPRDCRAPDGYLVCVEVGGLLRVWHMGR